MVGMVGNLCPPYLIYTYTFSSYLFIYIFTNDYVAIIGGQVPILGKSLEFLY